MDNIFGDYEKKESIVNIEKDPSVLRRQIIEEKYAPRISELRTERENAWNDLSKNRKSYWKYVVYDFSVRVPLYSAAFAVFNIPQLQDHTFWKWTSFIGAFGGTMFIADKLFDKKRKAAYRELKNNKSSIETCNKELKRLEYSIDIEVDNPNLEAESESSGGFDIY